MKQSFKIGKIVLQGTKVRETSTRLTDTTSEVIKLQEDTILEDFEVSIEMSVEEMKESFSNYKEVCKGIKDLYLFIKDELVNGEAAKIASAINELTAEPPTNQS